MNPNTIEFQAYDEIRKKAIELGMSSGIRTALETIARKYLSDRISRMRAYHEIDLRIRLFEFLPSLNR